MAGGQYSSSINLGLPIAPEGIIDPHLYSEFSRIYVAIRQLQLAIPAPAGFIFLSAGPIPSGYLLCNGAAISRTDYADLFGRIGVTYGPGDGVTTFNIPVQANFPVSPSGGWLIKT